MNLGTNNAHRPAGGCRIFHSNPDEDGLPCKPEVLTSEPATQLLSGHKTNSEYSGGSERLHLSKSSQNSQSDKTCSGQDAGSGSRILLRIATDDSSLQPGGGSSSLSDAEVTRTPSVHVTEYPSANLGGVPPTTNKALTGTRRFPHALLDSTARSPSSCPAENPDTNHSNCSEDPFDATPFTMCNSMWLAIGFALASVMGFVLYKKLKK